MNTPLIALLVMALSVTFLQSACNDETPKIVGGKDFPFARMVAIRRGSSTQKDVEELLGTPYRKESTSDRRTRWRYYVRKEQAQRVLGIFRTSTHVTEHRLEVIFDGPLVESIEKESKSFKE